MKTKPIIGFILLSAISASGAYAEVATEHDNVNRKERSTIHRNTGAQNNQTNPVGVAGTPPAIAPALNSAGTTLGTVGVAPVPAKPLTLVPLVAPVVAPIIAPPPTIIAMPILPAFTPPPIVIPPPPLVLFVPPIIQIPRIYVTPPRIYLRSNIVARSDRRLKMNIHRIGTHRLGIGIYEYDYVWGEHAIGVMADEVKLVKPEAVIRGQDGYDSVDYSKLN
jgi:hypothetical protein